MKKTCFVTPVYSKKFDFAEQMVRSYNSLYDDDHLFLVFSDDEESNLFKQSYPDLRYRTIIYTGDKALLEVDRNPPAQKKFFGIKYIFDNTEFDRIGMIDDDSKFFKKVDYDDLFKRYLDRATVFTTFIPRTENLDKINFGCLRFFKESDYGQLRHMTSDFNTFFWFNDIPVFDRNDFYEFYDYVDLDKIKNQFTVTDFEHVLYVYFLLLKGKMKLQTIQFGLPLPYGSFIELQKYINQQTFAEIFNIMQPMWIINPIDEQYMKNTFMFVHVDRK